jgi:hypothetical protein
LDSVQSLRDKKQHHSGNSSHEREDLMKREAG